MLAGDFQIIGGTVSAAGVSGFPRSFAKARSMLAMVRFDFVSLAQVFFVPSTGYVGREGNPSEGQGRDRLRRYIVFPAHSISLYSSVWLQT